MYRTYISDIYPFFLLALPDYLLVGKDTVAKKFDDAASRSVVTVSLRRLQDVLLGRNTLESLASDATLISESFQGAAYQPALAAGAEQPCPAVEPSASSAKQPPAKKAAKKEAKKPAAKKPAAKKPAPSKSATVDLTSTSPAAAAAVVPAAAAASSSTAIVAHSGKNKKAKFTIPRPGVNGAVANVLEGKKFVLTGTFPEIGGGAGLSLGKERTKSIIEDFGGKKLPCFLVGANASLAHLLIISFITICNRTSDRLS